MVYSTAVWENLPAIPQTMAQKPAQQTDKYLNSFSFLLFISRWDCLCKNGSKMSSCVESRLQEILAIVFFADTSTSCLKQVSKQKITRARSI